MSILERTDTLFAFVDALGVVIARLVVVIVISVIAVLPFGLLLILTTDAITAPFFLWFAIVSFVSMNVLLAFEYYLFALKGLRHSSETREFIAALSPRQKILVSLIAFPAKVVHSGIVILDHLLSGRSYVRQMTFDILGLYFSSFWAFVAIVYTMAVRPELSSWMFTGAGPRSLLDAILFGIEMATRGFFFDLLEHFQVHLSTLQLSNNFWGRAVTFILRFSSSALAISLVFELIKATKIRLEKLEAEAPP